LLENESIIEAVAKVMQINCKCKSQKLMQQHLIKDCNANNLMWLKGERHVNNEKQSYYYMCEKNSIMTIDFSLLLVRINISTFFSRHV